MRGGLFQAAVGLLCAAPVLLGFFGVYDVNHDIAWLLHCSTLWLDGGTPYVDFFENNPPLILWLGMPAVGLGRLFGWPAWVAYDLLVLTAAASTAAMVQVLLRSVSGEEARLRRHLVGALLTACLILAPGWDFGQRDHLAVIFFVPSLVAATLRLDGRTCSAGWAVAVGLWAALGFGLKPPLLLVWAGVEVLLAVSRRDALLPLRRENWAIGAGLLAYAGATVWLAPGFFEVAGWSLDLYGAYANPVPLHHPGFLLAWLGVMAFLVVRDSEGTRALRRVGVVALLATIAVVVWQNRGFTYHFAPPRVLGGFSLGLAVLAAIEHPRAFQVVTRLPARWAPTAFLAALVAFALLWTSCVVRQTFWSGGSSPVAALAQLVERHAPSGPIVVYSTSVYLGFPLASITGATWISRFANLWIVPGVYSDFEKRSRPFPYHERSEMGEMERFQIDSVVEDLERTPPELIIFDRSRKKQGMGRTLFDFEVYLRRDPRFERIFAGFTKLADVGPYRVYQKASPATTP